MLKLTKIYRNGNIALVICEPCDHCGCKFWKVIKQTEDSVTLDCGGCFSKMTIQIKTIKGDYHGL